jgi:hypothetical protein
MKWACMALFVGCGPANSTYELALAPLAALGDVGSLQISALSQKPDCLDIVGRAGAQPVCIKDAGFAATRFATFRTAQGREVRSLSLPISANNSVQRTSVSLPADRDDLAVVIEALSKEPTPRLVGIGCNFVTQRIAVGENPAVTVQLRLLRTPVNCDPRFE